jgi:uncharacterized protein GlcG (DUF336 family)
MLRKKGGELAITRKLSAIFYTKRVRKIMNKKIAKAVLFAALGVSAGSRAWAGCSEISRDALLQAAESAVTAENSGFNLEMWVTMVDETGKVCHVVNTAGSGETIGNSSWLGSRVISAQKANTANAFSLDGFSISTANLYGLTQPGGSLYGLQHSNPVEAATAYKGNPKKFGAGNDPLVNKRVGGVNVFGGGLALYVDDNGDAAGGIRKIGAIGVSGDTSCTDHAVAWRIRNALTTTGGANVNKVPAGFHSASSLAEFAELGDEMVIAADNTATANTTYQPTCAFAPTESAANGVIVEAP